VDEIFPARKTTTVPCIGRDHCQVSVTPFTTNKSIDDSDSNEDDNNEDEDAGKAGRSSWINSRSSIGIVIGVVCGVALLLVILVVTIVHVILYTRRQKRLRRQEENLHSPALSPSAAQNIYSLPSYDFDGQPPPYALINHFSLNPPPYTNSCAPPYALYSNSKNTVIIGNLTASSPAPVSQVNEQTVQHNEHPGPSAPPSDRETNASHQSNEGRESIERCYNNSVPPSRNNPSATIGNDDVRPQYERLRESPTLRDDTGHNSANCERIQLPQSQAPPPPPTGVSRSSVPMPLGQDTNHSTFDNDGQVTSQPDSRVQPKASDRDGELDVDYRSSSNGNVYTGERQNAEPLNIGGSQNGGPQDSDGRQHHLPQRGVVNFAFTEV